MLNVFKKISDFINEKREAKTAWHLLRQETAFLIESKIIALDKKRKEKLNDDELAKEVLLYDDCLIIDKNALEEYIFKEFL